MNRSKVFLLALFLSLWGTALSQGREAQKASALFSLVVEFMQTEDGLLPQFRETTVAEMREEVFGRYERDQNQLNFVQLEWGNPYLWGTPGLIINLDYDRFTRLPPYLEVSYSYRAACPAQPYLESNQFTTSVYGGSVANRLAESFAYYYYLEQALSQSMGINSPLTAASREEVLRQAEQILSGNWQSLSNDQTTAAIEDFETFLYGEILDFSHNEFALQMAENGISATFVHLETWECGGYEGKSYIIGQSASQSRIMVIPDLDHEICKALNFDPWSPEECLAWQPFPDEDMLAVGWFRVLSFDDQGTALRGSIRPPVTAFDGENQSEMLLIPIDSALR